MRRERRKVALAYLSALRAEFERLLDTARIIAALSPEVVAGQEFERLILAVNFFGDIGRFEWACGRASHRYLRSVI